MTVRAKIVDEMSLEQASVYLYYRDASRLDEADFIETVMFDDGLHNDGKSDDGVYACILPALPHGTVIEFYIMARDVTGHQRSWPAPTQMDEVTWDQSVNALYQVDDTMYTGSQLVCRLVMTEIERQELEFINRSSNAQMNATLISQEGSRQEVRYNVGVRIRGAGSRKRTPPNYRVNIPKDRRWQDVSAINLNTQYTYNQLLGSVLSQQSGLPAANARAVQVRVNGENLAQDTAPQFGSYVLTEVINGDWAQNHYPLDRGGNTYSCRRPNTRLSYLGDNPEAYLKAGYSKTSNVSDNDWSDLIQLTEVLSEASDATYIEEVMEVANVQEWMTYFAVLSLLAYGETALGTGVGDDYNLYRGGDDPRFLLLPHDLDTILGQGDGSTRPYNLSIYLMEGLPVIRRLMREPYFREIYHHELERLLNSVFTSEQFDPLVDHFLEGWISAEVIREIKQFNTERHAYVTSILTDLPQSVLATISGEPPARTTSNNCTLIIGGDITHYRYRLNGGNYSSVLPVEQSIHLYDLAVGSYTVAVIGQNAQGQGQAEDRPTLSRTWTVLPSRSDVIINEVLAKNTAAVSYHGRYIDLVELANMSHQPVDLSGMSLSDDISDLRKFVFPAGTVLPAGAYLTLGASDAQGTVGLYLGFSLDRDGEAIYLYDAQGRLMDEVVFGPQLDDWSVGRLSDGRWGLTYPSFGSENRPAETSEADHLLINEWLALGDDEHPDDFVELYNPQPYPVDVGGLFLTDNPIGAPHLHQITPLSFIEAHSFLVFVADGQPENGTDHVNFKLAAEQGMIGLLNQDSQWIDSVIYTSQQAGQSLGLWPDGDAAIYKLVVPTPGQANQ